MNYYNEHDKNAAAWLRELILLGLIPGGDVDERSIVPAVGAEFVRAFLDIKRGTREGIPMSRATSVESNASAGCNGKPLGGSDYRLTGRRMTAEPWHRPT